ncbi:relaxase domain-containing protein [Streptomyces sp. G9]|uniref:relaxase domain-containing protein n=1 Tax=Streptomyces sp. G9 TaxID=1684483 RepID=UPI003D734587
MVVSLGQHDEAPRRLPGAGETVLVPWRVVMLSGAYRCRTCRSARDRRRRRPARTPLRAAAQEQAGVPTGRWTGRGLAALGLATGEEVTEARLRNLFGERGRHPDAKGVPRRRIRHRPCCPFRVRAAPPLPTPPSGGGEGPDGVPRRPTQLLVAPVRRRPGGRPG